MTGLYELRPFLLVGIGLLAVVVAVVVVRILMRSASSATFEDAAEGPAPPPAEPVAAAEGASGLKLASSFRQALSRLKSYGAVGVGTRYEVPWCLMMGAAGSRPPDLFADSGINLPLGPPADLDREGRRGVAWWFLGHGAVLDLEGDYVLGRDGVSSDQRGLRKFLRLLQRHRPRRPLDALVITVPARDLLEGSRAGAGGLVELERRASLIEDRLWLLVRQLGWRCPTTVLVTGCEVLPGFSGFCAALPSSRLGEAFGWASPHALDAAWRPTWVQEAFDTLGRRLELLKLELLAEGVSPGLADDVFRFPPALAELEGALAAFLDPLFKPSAYAETSMLRGIYFTGELASPHRRRVFLEGLFEHKVFRERALAAPTRASLVSRNRRVLVTQVGVSTLAAVLTVGTLLATLWLTARERNLRPFLNEVAINLGEIEGRRQEGKPVPLELVREHAQHLLEGMTRVDADDFWAFFLPASWPPFSRLDDDLVEVSVRAYDRVIFDAFHGELVEKAKRLTQARTEGGRRFIAWPAATDEVAAEEAGALPLSLRLKPVASVAELAEWNRWLDDAEAFERHVAIYNRLHQTRDLGDLAALVKYLFDVTLPRAFFEHARLYREALGRPELFQPFELETYREPARERAEGMGLALYERLGPGNELLQALRGLAWQLDSLAESAAWANVDQDQLAVLVDSITEVEHALSLTDLEWAFREPYDLGPSHAEALRRTAASLMLGTDLSKTIEEEGKELWTELRLELGSIGSVLTGPLLAIDEGKPQMQISADLAILKTAIQSFSGEGFVQEAELRRFARVVPAGQHLIWNASGLEDAERMAQVWDRFETETLRQFPRDLQRQVGDAARQRLGERMDDLVARAQRFESVPEVGSAVVREPALAIEVAAFQDATQPLSRLLDAYRRLRLEASAQALTELANSQAESLLGVVDRLLEAEAPYRPRQGGFGWWNGRSPVALAAYEVGDAAELGLYLELERQRIANIARRYAEPLLAWLSRQGIAQKGGGRSLYLRWEGILLSLKQHEGAKPGNPVTALEDLITGTFTKVTPTSCGIAPATSTQGSTNFFLMRRDELARDLTERCGILVAEHARERWREVSRSFTDKLAGRFPFARAVPEGLTREVDIADLRAFFQLFAAARGEILATQTVEPPAFGPAQDDVLGFVAEMAKAETFFASLLASPELEPAFPVEVLADFRVNQPPEDPAEREALAVSPEVELGGERIIEWTLESGDQRITHRDTERRLAWRPGLPVALTLRWAEDSPRLPEARWFTADGQTVVYCYEGRWSLLALLAAHQSRDPRPHTLRLVIPTEPNPRALGTGGDEPATRVFVRLRLATPAGEGKPPQNLTLPRFPLAVPAVPEPVAATDEAREAP
ncbi:MAG TPA: type VI secretion system protein [Thermoanaerobaculia bacterium]|nr:type VI secretion system protein [Thermoanaerobaculia bacterium]